MPLYLAGLFKDRGQARRVVDALLDAGYKSEDIALALRDRAEEDVTQREELGEDAGQFRELAIHSAWERLGWLGGARPEYRNHVAPQIKHAIVTAGPLAIAIGGAQVGASAGGVVGAITNFGFPHDLAKQWRAGVLEGQAWLMLRTTETGAEQGRGIMQRYQPDLPAESLRHW